MTVSVREIEPRDAERWAALYNGYRDFYALAPDDELVANAWQWFLERRDGLVSLVAVDADDSPIALANVRWFARPSEGCMALYLDDLFTSPEARGIGAASALLTRINELAGERGAKLVRWITASDNVAARSVYDRFATATPWITYDMRPAAK